MAFINAIAYAKCTCILQM